MKKDDPIIFKIEEALALGIIEEVHPEEVWVLPLDEVKSVPSTDSVDGQLWRFPDPINLVAVEKEAILPCFPSLELDRVCSMNLSGAQTIMFRLFNDDVLKLFCKQV